MILIILFVIVNILICRYYYKQKEDIINAPFVLNIMAITSMTPMMYMIYDSPHYTDSMFYRTSMMMILCHIMFHIGYKKAINTVDRGRLKWRIFRLNRIIAILILFVIFGFISIAIYKRPSSRVSGLWVIAAQFMSYDVVALIISIFLLIYDRRIWKVKWRFLILLILSAWPIYDYAMNVKGSRSRVFFLLLLGCYLISNLYPQLRKKVKLCFVFLFIFGSILSASIVEYRESINGSDSFKKANFWQNYKESFNYHNISSNGMDLANCAMGMEYCAQNSHYSLGTIFIDRLIFNYVPARIIGESNKKKMMLSPEDAELENRYTNGVTTMTGYYEAFNCFGYIGILLFWLAGFGMGTLYRKKEQNVFYYIGYFFSVIYVNILITHGLSYILSNYVFFMVFISPFLYLATKKINIINNRYE